MRTQIQIKPCCSWRYIDVLRHEIIGLCEKLNSIYIIFLPLVQAMSNFVSTYVDNDPYVSRPIETVANE